LGEFFFTKKEQAFLRLLRRGGDEENEILLRKLSLLVHQSFLLWYRTSHLSLIKQSTGLFYFTVRAFRSSILTLIAKQKSHTLYDFFVLVEMRRIELLSENIFTPASTSVDCVI